MNNVLLILGTPRAGTSWLAKIFDSHRRVVYRHEPDEILVNRTIPPFCRFEDYPRYGREAARYLDRLADVRTTKTIGSPPIFSKDYRSPLVHFLHLLMIGTLRLPETVPFGKRLVRQLQIPFSGNSLQSRPALLVMKSVSLLDRAGLFARTVPNLRVVVIIRNPVGFIASRLRGLQRHKFLAAHESWFATTQYARCHGIDPDEFGTLPLVDQLAWEWRLCNEKALEDLAGCGNAKVVLHRDMVFDAKTIAKELFAFAGLEWSSNTEAFLEQSQNATGSRNRYYSVYRRPDFKERMDSWGDILTPEEVERIEKIVTGSRPWHLLQQSNSRTEAVQ